MQNRFVSGCSLHAVDFPGPQISFELEMRSLIEFVMHFRDGKIRRGLVLQVAEKIRIEIREKGLVLLERDSLLSLGSQNALEISPSPDF